MIKKISIYMFFIWVLFSDVFITTFKIPKIFLIWDIILEVLLMGLFIYKVIITKKLNKEFSKSYIYILLIILVGLAGDIFFRYFYSFEAILRDIATFLKFPLTFLLIKDLKFEVLLSKYIDEKFIKILKIIVLIIAAFALINIFFDVNMSMGKRYGIRSYKFLFSHQTFLVITMVFILTLFEFRKDKINNLLLYEIIISVIILTTMRTKGIMFLGLFWTLKLFWKFIKKHKRMAIVGILILVGMLATHKIITYMGYSYSTRETLYKGCITLLAMCFPIGSGFGTFASHISGIYRSKVYEFIDLSYVWQRNYISQLGDVGFPYYIGQFGIVGCVFIVLLAREIVKIALKNVKDKTPILLLFGYIIIGLTSESILLNYGAEVAIILAIISVRQKKVKIKPITNEKITTNSSNINDSNINNIFDKDGNPNYEKIKVILQEIQGRIDKMQKENSK